MDRNLKRVVIIFVYLLVFCALGLVVYFLLQPDPSCNDGIKNQGETGIDCGGPCAHCKQEINRKKLEVKSLETTPAGNDTYDVVLKIYNPNKEYGAKEFRFFIQDNLGNKSPSYTDFILPGEEKYIVINDFIIHPGAENLSVGIDNQNIEWKRAVDYYDPKLVVYNQRYEKSATGSTYAQVKGLLINKSPVDYETIKVKAILRHNGQLLGASYHIMNTLPAGSKREFVVQFPHGFTEEVNQIEVEPETNIFDSDNYLRIEGKGNLLDK